MAQNLAGAVMLPSEKGGNKFFYVVLKEHNGEQEYSYDYLIEAAGVKAYKPSIKR
jgi:hypothetical protein